MNIEKAWQGVGGGQCVRDDKGEVWLVVDLIDQAKDLPVLNIPLAHLCIDRVILPETKIKNFVQHMKQVNDSDLSYPILLCDEGTIIDGSHRVIKAFIEGRTSIKAKRFINRPISSYREQM